MRFIISKLYSVFYKSLDLVFFIRGYQINVFEIIDLSVRTWVMLICCCNKILPSSLRICSADELKFKFVKPGHQIFLTLLLLIPGAELSLIAENFGFPNDLLLPFLSILDTSCPISDLRLANFLFDVILSSVLGSSLWSFAQGFPIK